jgi:hypothetical protein
LELKRLLVASAPTSAQVVDDGLSQVDRRRIAAVLALHFQDPLRREVQGLPPADPLPLVPAAQDRMPQAVGILVQVFECRGLRADLTPAERILLVAPDRGNPSVFHLDLDPATGFAEDAGPMNDAFHEDLLCRVPRFESTRTVRGYQTPQRSVSLRPGGPGLRLTRSKPPA